jgi:hypothetical protein
MGALGKWNGPILKLAKTRAWGGGSNQILDTPSALAPMQSHIDSIAQARVIGDFALLASAKRAILQRPALGYSAAGTTKNHGRISR